MRTIPCSVKHVERCSRLLSASPRSIADLCRAMPWRGRFTLDGLGQAAAAPAGALTRDFYRDILPHIVRRAAALPIHFPSGTPVIDTPRAVQLPRPAVASIVASMFLGLLPPLEPEEEERFNNRSMLGMLSSAAAPSVAKTRCILHYFERLLEMEAVASLSAAGPAPSGLPATAAGGAGTGASSASACTPSGSMVFRRVKLSPVPAVADSSAPLVPINVCSAGGIDDAADALHTDFANRLLGGGVLRSGAVQEEIMMAVAPDSLAGLAMMPVMADDEAIIITGAERFSATSGYSHTLAFAGDLVDPTPRWRDRVATAGSAGGAGAGEGAGAESAAGASSSSAAFTGLASLAALALRADVSDGVVYDPDLILKCIVAIDAVPWYHVPDVHLVAAQLAQSAIDRELTKALTGFAAAGPECSKQLFPRIATGRWGCGAFRGDDNVKALVQWIAASLSGRAAMDFYPFSSALLDEDLRIASAALAEKGSSRAHAGAMYRALVEFGRLYGEKGADAAYACAASLVDPRERSLLATRRSIIRAVVDMM